MAQTQVVMKKAAGLQPDAFVNLPDGSRATPDADGKITVSANFITALLGAGYQIVVDSGTTHVP